MRRADEIRELYRQALLDVRTHLGSDWRAVEFRDEAVNWALFASTRRRMRDQGWKIHLASSIGDAPRLFADVVPALLAGGCAFKVPASIDDAITINSGRAGRALIGKILTAYPGDDGEVADLAGELDRVWQSDQAPEILTDLRLRPGSAVYIRFGAFTSGAAVADARAEFIMAPCAAPTAHLCRTSAALMDCSPPGRIHQLKARSRFKRRRNGS